MVAVILRPLAPFVEALVARRGLDGAHRLTAAAVGALEARRQIAELEIRELPGRQPPAHGAKLLAERRDPLRQGAVAGKLLAARHQRPAHAHEPAPVDLARKTHLQARIGLEQGLGVAQRRKILCRVADRCVLAAIDVVADAGARQAQQGAQTLAAFAGLVDRLLAIDLRILDHALRPVELLAGNALEPDIVLQTIAHRSSPVLGRTNAGGAHTVPHGEKGRGGRSRPCLVQCYGTFRRRSRRRRPW